MLLFCELLSYKFPPADEASAAEPEMMDWWQPNGAKLADTASICLRPTALTDRETRADTPQHPRTGCFVSSAVRRGTLCVGAEVTLRVAAKPPHNGACSLAGVEELAVFTHTHTNTDTRHKLCFHDSVSQIKLIFQISKYCLQLFP